MVVDEYCSLMKGFQLIFIFLFLITANENPDQDSTPQAAEGMLEGDALVDIPLVPSHDKSQTLWHIRCAII